MQIVSLLNMQIGRRNVYEAQRSKKKIIGAYRWFVVFCVLIFFLKGGGKGMLLSKVLSVYLDFINI